MRCTKLLLLVTLVACSRGPIPDKLLELGYQDLQRGNLSAARARAEEGRRHAGERNDALWEWRFRVLQAEALVEDRRNPEALNLLESPARPEGPLDRSDVRALITRGNAKCRSGRGAEGVQQADAHLEEAGRVAARLRAPELEAEVTRHRGTCALLRGDYTTAEARFGEALAVARQEGWIVLEAKVTGSLGLLRVRTRRYDEAAEWLGKALELASRSKNDLDVVKTLTNLGWCYYRLGDDARALDFLSRGESLAKERGYEGERLLALQNIGNVRFRARDLPHAAEAYREAFAIAKKIGSKKIMAELVANLGEVALQRGLYDEAQKSVRDALSMVEEIEDLGAKQYSLVSEGEIWAARKDYLNAERRYREVLGSPHTDKELGWEVQIALALLKVETHDRRGAEENFRKAFQTMEQSWEELRQSDHRISFFSNLRQVHDSYVEFLVGGQRSLKALEVADQSRARFLRGGLLTSADMPAVTVQEFRAAARALDAVLLFYWVAPRRSFLWVVRPQGVELHVLPDVDEIGRHVEAHQTLVLNSRDPLAEGSPEAAWLYQNIVGPAEGSIPKGSRVIVVPDGPLYAINLETLVVPSGRRHYWIEDVTLATTPSLALLVGHKAGGSLPPPHGILLIGDPIPSEEFPRLPNASQEMKQIADQFAPEERRIYAGAQARPSVYREADPRRFSLIHFATHASANPVIPLDSAVVLSQSNDTYKLYAREIVTIPLQADLVTLSACRSAGSRTFAGEGLVGLAWAFMSAGAQNVVAGLWNVEDRATSELMEELYRGLREGLAPAQALHRAKLRFLESGTAYRKPFYWAPFVVSVQRPAARGSKGA